MDVHKGGQAHVDACGEGEEWVKTRFVDVIYG